MYSITIYDKSKNIFKTYEHIHTIRYFDILEDWLTISGNEILSHNFPCSANYQLISDCGNYSISKSIIGSFEVECEV